MQFLVELVCIVICCTAEAPLGIVYNFISLAVIADFDNFMFEAVDNPITQLCDEDRTCENGL